jgi:hypothetical protein
MDTRATRYAGKGHSRVQGWLTQLAVQILTRVGEAQQERGVRGPVCEIGVHVGRLFILLHLLTRTDEKSVAFDLYELQNEANGRLRKQRLMENLRHHGGDIGRTQAVTQDSLQLRPERIIELCGGRPRLFSIDGGRSAEVTRNDLSLAHDTLCEGGLVMLGDYFQEIWPEVSQGVCSFMQENTELFPVAIGGNKMFLARGAAAAEEYRKRLTEDGALVVRTMRIFGRPVAVIAAPTLQTRLARSALWRSCRSTFLGRSLRSLFGGLLR